MSRVLIVGGHGQVGSALVDALPGLGWSVSATTRRKTPVPGIESLRLDLSLPPEQWPALPPVDAAVICTAMTDQQGCEDNPDLSALINRDRPVALARALSAEGSFVLSLSTVGVFNGRTSRRRHDEAPDATIVYGRHKAEAERVMLNAGTAAVLRPSKIVGPDMPLLKNWIPALRAAEKITAFSDVTIAPISVPFIVTLIDKILRLKRHGIYQASGDQDVSYVRFAQLLCDAMGASPDLCDVRASNNISSSQSTTLDMSVEQELFGIGQPSSEGVMRDMINAALRSKPAA